MKTKDTKDLTYLRIGFVGLTSYTDYCKLKKCNDYDNITCRGCKNLIRKFDD